MAEKTLFRLEELKAKRAETCCLDAILKPSTQDPICFTNKPSMPWDNFYQQPDCAVKLDINFVLYTPGVASPSLSIDYNSLLVTDDQLVKLKLDAEKSLYVVTHGFDTEFTEDTFDIWMRPLQEELVRQGNNVIVTNWSKVMLLSIYN